MDTHGAPATLGGLLRHHRLRMGVNQADLARQAGISVRALRDIEQGRVARPRPESVRRLANVLELSRVDREAMLATVDGDARPGASRLRVDVLGPLVVHQLGRPVDIASSMQRSLLGLLALQPRRVVGAEEIVDVLWGEQPPRSCLRLVYVYVGQLRGLLEPKRAQRAPARVLRRVRGGYLLELADDQLDLAEFDAMSGSGRRAQEAGDLPAAHGSLGRSLRLWRGPVLAGGSPRLRQHPVAVAIGHRRIAAALAYADIGIALGHYGTAADRLRVLAADEPLHEAVAARLIVALAGAGQQAAALQYFADLRERLADELGVEPGREVRDAHLRVLRGEVPVVTPPIAVSAGPAAPAPRAPVPAQLPADVAAFTGRAEHLKQLDGLLPGEDTDRARSVVISAIAGTAGVGKTALAVHWAHRVREEFPDGQLYVNLRGFDPQDQSPVDPAEAIGQFLTALGVAPQRIPAGLDAQVGLYRSLLASRRVLVLLDNARDVEQVRPLLPGTPGCLALVTSRSQLLGLIAAEGAHPLALDLLTAEESWQLLARRLGPDRLAAEPAAVDAIVAGCARLPLALAIVAARAATHPNFPLAAVAGELDAARGGLDAFDGGDPVTDVRAVFSWSYRTLGAGAARLFRLLGSHPGPDIAAPAVASLAGLPLDRTRPLLTELTRAHLLTEHLPGRYTHHDLLRAYAAELTASLDPEPERRAATGRLLDHYLHTAHNGASLVSPLRDAVDPPPPSPGVTPQRFADHGQALAWFDAEHAAVLATVHRGYDDGHDAGAWGLAWATHIYLQRRGHWRDLGAVMRTALAAARRLADPARQAHAHWGIGVAHGWLAEYDDARREHGRALILFEQIGEVAEQARSRRSLAWIDEHEGRFADAFAQDRQALELYRAVDDVGGQASVHNAMGWYHAQLGDHRQALIHCQRALSLFLEIGNRIGQAHTWDSLGYANHHLGDHDQAAACYQHALELFREIGSRFSEADTLTHLGDARLDAGDPDAARHCWRQAVRILDQLGHPDAEAVRERLARPRG